MQKDIILLICYLLFLLYIRLTGQRELYKPAAVAVIFAITWSIIAHSEYGYNTAMLSGPGINLYPIVGWSFGLLAIYFIYRKVRSYISVSSIWQKLALINVFYIPLLLFAEFVAYHFLGVINLATASYPGIPLCDCLHAPVWMQAAYLAMASLFLVALHFLRLDPAPQRQHRRVTLRSS